MNTKENDRVRAARLKLIRSHVFFGCIAMQLDLVEDNSLDYLAAVDGKTIWYNSEQTKELTFPELTGLTAHEVMHPVLMHHVRRGNRNPAKWNRAGDYVINLILTDEGFTLPKGGLLDYQYRGMSTDQVYALLPDEDNDKGSVFDEVRDGGKDMDENDIKAEEGKIKAMIQNAAAMARKAGQLSGNMDKLVKAICEPKADWREVLRRFVSEKAEVDYSWNQPHQRMLQQFDIVYPTLDGEKLGQLVLLVDASGSTYKDQEQFCAELSDVLTAYECEVWVVFHDTQVTGVDYYTSDDLPIVLRPRGFGGTCARTAYEYIADNFDPDVIIHMTDGELSWGAVNPPNCPTLIACVTAAPGPDWATVVDIR